MEPEVDAIIQASVVKDSSQDSSEKPKLLEDLKSLRIIPETPVRKRENSKLDLKFISSQVAVCDEQDDNNPRTPKETVLDPFVNVSEHLEDPYGKISRRLDFQLGRLGKSDADPEEEEEEEEDCDDERLLESVLSENLLDVIVSEQAEELLLLLLPFPPADADDYDGFKTPIMSPTSVCGIAETCPAAPRKSTVGKKTLKIIDISLCKKLQF